jgi:hypothetical protein
VIGDLKSIEGRRAIALFTDGMDQRSIMTLPNVERLAQTTGVVIYVVGWEGHKSEESSEERVARQDLIRLAGESGGTATFIKKIQDLGDSFKQILVDLEAQYSISYPVPQGATGLRTIELRTRNRAHRVRVRNAYRVD